MNEQEWLTSADPAAMLERLQHSDLWASLLPPKGPVSDRKLRLFACACCRQVWPLLTDPRSRRAVEVAERYADGEVVREEMEAAAKDAVSMPYQKGDWYSLSNATYWCAAPAFDLGRQPAIMKRAGVTDATQAALLRDIVGNPFRPVTLTRAEEDVPELIRQLHPQHWPKVRWLTPAAVNVAQAIYDDCDWACLPILADALEEAGCTNADILGHLRGMAQSPTNPDLTPWEYRDRANNDVGTLAAEMDARLRNSPALHARGCWVLDLIIGKE